MTISTTARKAKETSVLSTAGAHSIHRSEREIFDRRKMSPIFCSLLCRRWKVTIILFVLGVTIVNGLRHGTRIPQYAGPYRVLVTRAWNTSDNYHSTGKLWVQLRTTQARGRQPQYGWGHSYLTVPVNDDMRVEARMAVRSNNQWKQNAFVFKFDKACSEFLIHARSLVEVIVGTNCTCPSPVKGLREIKNQTVDLVFPKFPIMPYGRYLFTLAIFQDKTVMGLTVADVELVPRV